MKHQADILQKAQACSSQMDHDDIVFMQSALREAVMAFERGEVPVGAILVRNREIIGSSHNQREGLRDPTAHAEILVLRNAAGISDSWRFLDATLYVTKEPCIMCAGAIVHARIRRLVYGCSDPRAGAVESIYQILGDRRLNHQVEVQSGVLADDCACLLRGFFEKRR